MWGASLIAFVFSSILAGAGQGVLFMTGMRAILERAGAENRTQTTTSYFIVAYFAIAIPAIGAGLISTAVDLKVTGLVSAGVIIALSVAAGLNARKFA